jgi:hypothetical protein
MKQSAWRKNTLNIAIILNLLLSSVALPAQAADLEVLFAGFERGCDINSHHFAFRNSLVRETDKSPNSGNYFNPGKPKIPKGVNALVGKLQFEENTKDGYALVTLPLRGQLYGLSVIEYTSWFGIGNGIHGFAFTINAPISKVRQTLKGKQIHFIEEPHTLALGLDPHKAQLIAKGRRTQIVCDRST